MPKSYEAMRNKFVANGMSLSQAKRKAAKIYNSKRKRGQKAVTGKSHGT